MMKRVSRLTMLIAAGALAGAASPGVALAQTAPAASQARPTPNKWNYEIRDGKRVPKGNRMTNPDGSWREELRQGSCVTVKEKTAAGEYKESRRCE
jgi:ABC-type sugar transport system substrate-binding protein